MKRKNVEKRSRCITSGEAVKQLVSFAPVSGDAISNISHHHTANIDDAAGDQYIINPTAYEIINQGEYNLRKGEQSKENFIVQHKGRLNPFSNDIDRLIS